LINRYTCIQRESRIKDKGARNQKRGNRKGEIGKRFQEKGIRIKDQA